MSEKTQTGSQSHHDMQVKDYRKDEVFEVQGRRFIEVDSCNRIVNTAPDLGVEVSASKYLVVENVGTRKRTILPPGTPLGHFGQDYGPGNTLIAQVDTIEEAEEMADTPSYSKIVIEIDISGPEFSSDSLFSQTSRILHTLADQYAEHHFPQVALDRHKNPVCTVKTI